MRVVIPSVDYGDFLAVMLPAWRLLIPTDSFIVATTPEDRESQEVAKRFGAETLVTDAFTRGGATLNLAAALDEAFAGTPDGEGCLVLDADVFPYLLPGGIFPSENELAPGTIYGSLRYGGTHEQVVRVIHGAALKELRFHLPVNLPYIKDRGREDSPEACGGYFQMFRYNTRRKFGSFPTVAKYDYEFAFLFPHGSTLKDFCVIHLDDRRTNWSGRRTPRWEGE